MLNNNDIWTFAKGPRRLGVDNQQLFCSLHAKKEFHRKGVCCILLACDEDHKIIIESPSN